MLFLSIYSLHLTLIKYDSCSIMSSPPNFVLTSSPSQASKLGDSRVLNNPSLGFDRDRLPAKLTQQNEEARAHEVAIEEQKRAKQMLLRNWKLVEDLLW